MRAVAGFGYGKEFFNCLGKRLRLNAANGLLTLFKCFECGGLNLPGCPHVLWRGGQTCVSAELLSHELESVVPISVPFSQ